VNVPLNAEIKALPFDDWDEQLKEIRMKSLKGESIELEKSVLPYGSIRLRPRAPLSARTTYEVEFRCTHTLYGDWCPLTSFTTGDAMDLTPPTFEGVSDYSYVWEALNHGCFSVQRHYDLKLAPAAEETQSDQVMYLISIEGVPSVMLAAEATKLGTIGWGPVHRNFPLEKEQELSIVVTAIDLAGNESKPSPVVRLKPPPWGCAPLEECLMGAALKVFAP
jgi:hypothetical protein